MMPPDCAGNVDATLAELATRYKLVSDAMSHAKPFTPTYLRLRDLRAGWFIAFAQLLISSRMFTGEFNDHN